MPSLHDLLTHAELPEVITALDKAMCFIVLYLRYEPTMLEEVLECYDNLYTLRKAIQTNKPAEHGNI